MRFDPISFLLGFLSASGLSFVMWRSRQRLARIQESAEGQIEGTRQFVGRAANERYTRDMVTYLQQRHVPAELISLTDVLLEPRLMPDDRRLDQSCADLQLEIRRAHYDCVRGR